MKTKLISIVFFAGLFTLKMASAQSLTFSYDGQDVSNGNIVVETAELYDDIQVDIPITNITDGVVSVKVMKEVIQEADGAYNSFCFGGACLPPTTTVAPFAEDLEPGEVYDFYGEYSGGGVEASTIVKYTAFNDNEPSDKVTVVVTIHFGDPNSVDKNMEDVSFSAYPNPAVGNDVIIDYSIPGMMESSAIVVYNMLGLKVFEQTVNNQSGKVQVNTSQFSKGIYLYVLENSGKTVVAKKLIVK